jgi:predicted DNA-binding WGR domain protein
MILHLESLQPEVNRLRFYRLEVVRDLLGAWCVIRRWGRIGTRGQMRVESYPSRHAAEVAAERQARRKVARGYVPPGSP